MKEILRLKAKKIKALTKSIEHTKGKIKDLEQTLEEQFQELHLEMDEVNRLFMGMDEEKEDHSSLGNLRLTDLFPRIEGLRKGMETSVFHEALQQYQLPVYIGNDKKGEPFFVDASKWPHMLLAGQTGSGKSVWMQQMVAGLSLWKSPLQVEFQMIDLKKTEWVAFEKLPHVKKIETEPKKALSLLKDLVKEMNERLQLLEKVAQKNIGHYNQNSAEKIPYIVCIIDEWADLVVSVGKDRPQEYAKALTAMGRAAGIHLILSTQRLDKDVLSGQMKANLPARICFSLPDARYYEQVLNVKKDFVLLGMGDGILQDFNHFDKRIRFQAPRISPDHLVEENIQKIVDYWKK